MKVINLDHHTHTSSSNTLASNPFAKLIDSRTVLEKKQFVSTGILTYIEGDVVEVEISDWHVFSLGDSLKVTVYSPLGILNFESTIVAKDMGSVIIIIPPEIQRKLMDKRQYPRIDISHMGKINQIFKTATRQAAIEIESPITIQIKDISIGGIGFVIDIEEQSIPFKNLMHMEAEIDFGFSFVSFMEVVRMSPIENGMFYGAKLLDIPQDKLVSLRAYILRSQVANYFKSKNEI